MGEAGNERKLRMSQAESLVHERAVEINRIELQQNAAKLEQLSEVQGAGYQPERCAGAGCDRSYEGRHGDEPAQHRGVWRHAALVALRGVEPH
jgi:hypothetical protein